MNLSKLIQRRYEKSSKTNSVELIKRVCGRQIGPLIMYTNPRDELRFHQMLCRCDGKAQQFLSKDDQIPLNLDCDCDGKAVIEGQEWVEW